MEEKEIMIGEVSLKQLADAQSTVMRSIKFCADNAMSEDREKRRIAQGMFAYILLEEMIKHEVIEATRKLLLAGMEEEKKAEKQDAERKTEVS